MGLSAAGDAVRAMENGGGLSCSRGDALLSGTTWTVAPGDSVLASTPSLLLGDLRSAKGRSGSSVLEGLGEDIAVFPEPMVDKVFPEPSVSRSNG
jgi:hypothetical protein